MKFKHSTTQRLFYVALCTSLWVLHVNGASAEEPVATKKPVVIKGGAIVEGFQLIAQTDTTDFAPSTPILVSVTLKNTSDSILAPVVSYAEADYRLEVTNVKGELLPETRYAQRHKKFGVPFFGIGTMEVAPGQTLQGQFIVNRHYDMTENAEYLIKVIRRSVPKLDKSGFVPIESNVIRVKVDDSVKPGSSTPPKTQ